MAETPRKRRAEQAGDALDDQRKGTARAAKAPGGATRGRGQAGAAGAETRPAKSASRRASSDAPAPKELELEQPRHVARRGAADALSGKYVYCIIQNSEPASFGTIGIGNEPSEVHTVVFEGIAAVVSDTPIEVYDPTRENVLAHERVNETVMQHHTVIPMSFGTVFKTADDIVELLRSAYGAFRDVLQKMENKLEFGLKVLWDPDEIINVVEKEDESLRRLREEILKQRGSTYFARMQYGRLVDSLLQERSEYYVREIVEALRPVSVATRSNKPIGERMIMNSAFLVSRDLVEEFDATVKSIGSRMPQLTFKYTGPWPPYNFVNIRLKLERAQEPE